MYVKQTNGDNQFGFKGKKQIGGHVNILSARSSVFAAMFTTNMQEVKTGQVVIKDIQLDIFKELLQYIYSARTKNSMIEETARLLFMAADKYYNNALKEECLQHGKGKKEKEPAGSLTFFLFSHKSFSSLLNSLKITGDVWLWLELWFFIFGYWRFTLHCS
jgi:hypothetical protein